MFAPASVSNVACGFDVMGFALEAPGDIVTAAPRDEPGVEISAITGIRTHLPLEPTQNTAGVAALFLLKATGSKQGVTLRIEKGIPFASGLGGSAASAAGGALATQAALGLDASPALLLRAALEAERLVASGSAHADNVAPCLYGGFVLLRGDSKDPEVVPLPVPRGLTCVAVHPHLEIETKHARAMLSETVPFRTAIRQWSNVGGLVAALFKEDFELLSRSLQDDIVEGQRKRLIPGFDAAKNAAIAAGALGCSISGAGPSLFALCTSSKLGSAVGRAMSDAFAREAKLESDIFVSPVGARGARVL